MVLWYFAQGSFVKNTFLCHEQIKLQTLKHAGLCALITFDRETRVIVHYQKKRNTNSGVTLSKRILIGYEDEHCSFCTLYRPCGIRPRQRFELPNSHLLRTDYQQVEPSASLMADFR